MRTLIRSVLLTLWIATIGWLVTTQVRKSVPPETVSTVSPGEVGAGVVHWFEVYLQGRKIGFVSSSLEPVTTGTRFHERSVLRLTTLGHVQTIHTSAWGVLGSGFELREMQLAMATDAATFEAKVAVEEGKVRIRAGSRGDPVLIPLPPGDAVYVPLGLRSALFSRSLERGMSVAGPVIDPTTQKLRRLHLEVIGRAAVPDLARAEGWRVEETWGDLRSVLWVSDEGWVLREEGPMGLVAVASSESQATRWDRDEEGGWDAVAAMAVPASSPLERPRERSELRVRLRGKGRQRVPDGAYQTWNGDVLTIRQPSLEEVVSYPLPYGGGTYAAELEATPTMQTDHPRIRALARVIVGPERDALAVTRLLLRWVHAYLAKLPVASLPDALETLDRGSGDCTEHAVLLATLARAAGIPARLVAGVVYGRDAFLYHAWVEVWLGTWLPIDPSLGQLPADATHIKLAEGGLEAQASLIQFFGDLGIEIVDPTPGQ